MTYEEFKKWCKENGLIVEESESDVFVKNEQWNNQVIISKEYTDVVLINTNSIPFIEKSLELAKTPLEERESQKKYYVVVKGDAFRLCANKRRNNGYLFISDEEENEGYQTKFTKQEAEEIMKRLSIEMVEVEG